MYPARRLTSGVLLLVTVLTALSGTAGSASATSGPVPNPSFENGWRDGKLACWGLSAGRGRLTLTRNGHTGRAAAYAEGRGRTGTRLKLTSDPSTACQIAVAGGDSYRLQFWLRSTAGAQPIVYAHSAKSGWKPWFTGGLLPAGPLQPYSVVVPAIPAGVDALSVGVTFDATSTVVLDDVALVAQAGRLLLRAGFPTDNSLVTNDFAYWSPADPRSLGSQVWDMTSGSLFAYQGNGYSGVPDDRIADALSRSSTHSAVFRLTTRDSSFGNVSVQTGLKVRRLSSTRSTPSVDWDGIHLFLHYKSQYRLYYASVARRDGRVVIKKKCPGGRSNNGTYFDLSDEREGYPIAFGSWRSVGATIRDNADGSVTITVTIDGRAAAEATDRGVGCAPITGPGAVGIRGDNAEFEFADYRVSALA